MRKVKSAKFAVENCCIKINFLVILNLAESGKSEFIGFKFESES